MLKGTADDLKPVETAAVVLLHLTWGNTFLFEQERQETNCKKIMCLGL